MINIIFTYTCSLSLNNVAISERQQFSLKIKSNLHIFSFLCLQYMYVIKVKLFR